MLPIFTYVSLFFHIFCVFLLVIYLQSLLVPLACLVPTLKAIPSFSFHTHLLVVDKNKLINLGSLCIDKPYLKSRLVPLLKVLSLDKGPLLSLPGLKQHKCLFTSNWNFVRVKHRKFAWTEEILKGKKISKWKEQKKVVLDIPPISVPTKCRVKAKCKK